VRHNLTIRLFHLFMVPKNCKKTWNTIMVLT
jgi:hypothetical protein